MPKSCAIRKLPIKIRQWLNNQLLLKGFSGYIDLSLALKKKGYPIPKSTIHRWGYKLKKKVDAAEVDRLVMLGQRHKQKKSNPGL